MPVFEIAAYSTLAVNATKIAGGLWKAACWMQRLPKEDREGLRAAINIVCCVALVVLEFWRE